jgi:hypothetical protein
MIDAKPRITSTSEGGNEGNSSIEAAPNGSVSNPTNEANATPLSTQQPELQHLSNMEPGPEPTDKGFSTKSGRMQMIDFAMLTRYGYLNVVADRNGV